MSQGQSLDFSTFILSVSSAAFMGMGLVPSPDGKKEKNMAIARHNIDLLEIIKEKTKGNLTADEQKLLDQLLYETRMRFIEAQK